jgi:hypothetical protein
MTADEVRDRIRKSRQELEDVIAGMDDEALSAPGPDGWAVKDHLVHVGAWEHWLLAMFENRDRLAAMGAPGARRTVDQINAIVWELHRHDSADEARAYFDQAHEQLMSVLAGQTTADFERPYVPFFDDDTRDASAPVPVLVAVEGNTYGHYPEHAEWIKTQTGNRAQR